MSTDLSKIYSNASHAIFDASLYTGDKTSVKEAAMNAKISATFESKIKFHSSETCRKFREYFHSKMISDGFARTSLFTPQETEFEHYSNGALAVFIIFHEKEVSLKITDSDWLRL